MDVSERSWFEYRKYIVNELARIDKGVSQLNDRMEIAMNNRDETISKMRIEIAMLKVQAGIWGAGAGIVTTAAFTIVLQALLHIHP